MTHIAIHEALDGKAVEWMEHVSDEQYGAGADTSSGAIGNSSSRRSRKVRGTVMLKCTSEIFSHHTWMIGSTMAQERIMISSEWGKVDAELVDNEATELLVQMLPLTIEMRDHLVRKRPATCLALARGRAATRFLDRYTGTLELRSFCHLLS